MKTFPSIRISIAALGCSLAGSAAAIDFVNDIQPIMEEHCWRCHSYEKDVKGNLAFDDLTELEEWNIGEFNIIRRGNPKESSFLGTMKLDPSSPDFMPRKGRPLPKSQLDLIEKWIKEGAVIDAEEMSDGEKAYLAGKSPESKPDSRQEYLEWTNTEGKTIEARFQRMAGDKVTLLMKNGTSYNYPLDNLSPESQAQAKKLGGE